MELMDALYQRRTVRAYTDEAVPRETIEILLQAAVQAPTGMNMQPWAFGVLQGADVLRDLSDRAKAFLLENIDRFPGFERYRDMMANPETNLCYGASACIVVYATPNGVTTDNDCTMAAQNIMLAATDLGLGTCWVGFLGFTLNDPDVKRQFGVPEDYRVVAPIIVGSPLGEVPPVEKNPPQVLYWQE